MKFKFLLFCVYFTGLVTQADAREVVSGTFEKQATVILRKQVLKEADWALKQQPVTVTAQSSSRSAGTRNDFFSEGDYWWPDPKNAEGPYIQKDGLTNPDNFVAHRLDVIRFSKIIAALASAYKITGKDVYMQQAILHLNAWFVNPETMMNPNLQYAQAIKGRFTGRGIGIIDAIQFMEVAQGISVFEKSGKMDAVTLTKVKNWFKQYLDWVTTSKNGLDEKNAENNHGVCWVMQVAAFARFTRDEDLLTMCRDRYKNVLLPVQMAADGSFPRETKRTKPYGYSLFTLDAMTMICQILSTKNDNLWTYKTPDGRSIKTGIGFMFPYVRDKVKWPFKKDVMYWGNWPIAQPFLIMAANAFSKQDWYNTWEKLDHNPQVEEVIRNLPVRHPLIWFN